jgi:hypothetical protein
MASKNDEQVLNMILNPETPFEEVESKADQKSKSKGMA